ncbi:MAG TPA: polysaccharide deacetylase family protein [Acidobacteriaceae bacterium]
MLSSTRVRRAAMSLGAKAFWRIPARFTAARILGRDYALRCVVFHHIAEAPSPFTAGISVSITPRALEAALQFLSSRYVPVRLEDVLTNGEGRGLPDRAVLVTFDDAYASVGEYAAPLCRRYHVPAAFFVNAAFVDNRRLAPDNLVCYAVSMLGMDIINRAIGCVFDNRGPELHTLAELFGVFFPTITLEQRTNFLDALCRLSGINEESLARDANLYLTSRQLRDLSSPDFEIGNHTYTHTHCRSFSEQDFASEIDRNKAELESMCGARVRSFSQPYGSSRDVTRDVIDHLERSGHQAVFLSESVANPRNADLFHLDRVSTSAASDDALFFELEVLPRIRAIRHKLFTPPGVAGRAPAAA